VQKAYGNEGLNRSKVFRWYSLFRDGRELVEDDERGDRPKSTGTDVNIAAVAAYLLKNDGRIASRMITIFEAQIIIFVYPSAYAKNLLLSAKMCRQNPQNSIQC
jgi:hypothetical protein